MNEKIKLLAEQSQLWDRLDPRSLGIPGGSTESRWGEELQEFAELIVRECRDIVEQDMKLAHIQMIPLTLEKYANGRLKEKIREHFGVEE